MEGSETAVEIISPMIDIMFKRMFSMPDSKPMLRDFLGTYIDFQEGEVKDIQLIDKELKRTPQEKNSIMDLRVDLGGAQVDVEVQMQSTIAFKDRVAYYLAKMYADQFGESESYDRLRKCVSLCITNFPLFKDESFFRSMRMRDEYGNVLTQKMEFDCLEISKIRKLEISDGMDKKLQWAKLFAVSSEEELNMVKEKSNNPAIDQAVLTIKHLSANEELRLEAEARLKEKRDKEGMYIVGFDNGKAKGKAEGRAEGRAEERANMIAKMRESGLSEEQIDGILNGSAQKQEPPKKSPPKHGGRR